MALLVTLSAMLSAQYRYLHKETPESRPRGYKSQYSFPSVTHWIYN